MVKIQAYRHHFWVRSDLLFTPDDDFSEQLLGVSGMKILILIHAATNNVFSVALLEN